MQIEIALLLRAELESPRWKPQTLVMSGVTDPYQPIERKLRIARGCLEVLAQFRNPVAIITKNRLVTRDVDLSEESVPRLLIMDADGLCDDVQREQANDDALGLMQNDGIDAANAEPVCQPDCCFNRSRGHLNLRHALANQNLARSSNAQMFNSFAGN